MVVWVKSKGGAGGGDCEKEWWGAEEHLSGTVSVPREDLALFGDFTMSVKRVGVARGVVEEGLREGNLCDEACSLDS